MTRPARPTLADVAARAGVSLKTASRALNGEYGVAEATAERVREVAGQLGFRLNYLARALATRQTSATVGLVIPTVSDPVVAALAAEVEATLAPRELGLISASHGDDMARQRMLTGTLVERRVDALVVVSAPGDSSYLQLDIAASPLARSTGRWRVSLSTPSLSTTATRPGWPSPSWSTPVTSESPSSGSTPGCGPWVSGTTATATRSRTQGSASTPTLWR